MSSRFVSKLRQLYAGVVDLWAKLKTKIMTAYHMPPLGSFAISSIDGGGRNVNVFINNWQWTGSDVLVPQAMVDIELYWKDNTGADRSWSGVATFPDDLQLMPVVWVKEALEELLLRAARKRLGVDD